MERKDVAVTRFFKVIMPGFEHKLLESCLIIGKHGNMVAQKLPTAISKELQKEKSRTATLQSRIGSWKISMCSNSENENDDLICFNQGWPQFVDRHALSVGDLLYFIHTGDLHFHVYVFDQSACEKEFCDELTKEEATEALNLINHRKNSRREEAVNPILYFEKEMAPFCATATKMIKIHIPIEFMRLNNLGLRTSVTLRDPSGRAWPMKLFGDNRLDMYGEWPDFYASNGIKDGDICVFLLLRRLLTPTTLFFDIQILRSP